MTEWATEIEQADESVRAGISDSSSSPVFGSGKTVELCSVLQNLGQPVVNLNLGLSRRKSRDERDRCVRVRSSIGPVEHWDEPLRLLRVSSRKLTFVASWTAA